MRRQRHVNSEPRRPPQSNQKGKRRTSRWRRQCRLTGHPCTSQSHRPPTPGDGGRNPGPRPSAEGRAGRNREGVGGRGGRPRGCGLLEPQQTASRPPAGEGLVHREAASSRELSLRSQVASSKAQSRLRPACTGPGAENGFYIFKKL